MKGYLIEQPGEPCGGRPCLAKRPFLLKRLWRKVWASMFGNIPNIHKSKVIERAVNKYEEVEDLYVAIFLNDAFDIGIGFPDKWLVILRRKTLHKLILWYIWRLSWGEWFGLRRWLFCKILERRVNKYKKFEKEPLLGEEKDVV